MLNFDLDEIDLKILSELQPNARLPNVELAAKVGLSASPCLRRVRRLESLGVIKGYATLVDANTIKLPVSVFIHVTLDKQIEPALEDFERRIQDWPEVMECYLMTGDADYHLRVVTADLSQYERFLMDKLTRLPGVASIKSAFSLKQVVYRTALPVVEPQKKGKKMPVSSLKLYT